MRVVCFRYSGKYGHFLRAEANANGITYPYPPRTVLLGLIGAVLGLAKDEPQVRLADAKVAVGGGAATTVLAQDERPQRPASSAAIHS